METKFHFELRPAFIGNNDVLFIFYNFSDSTNAKRIFLRDKPILTYQEKADLHILENEPNFIPEYIKWKENIIKYEENLITHEKIVSVRSYLKLFEIFESFLSKENQLKIELMSSL